MSDNEDLPTRLRREAEIIPYELYAWLNPLLIEAAAEIERLRAALHEIAHEPLDDEGYGDAKRIAREALEFIHA